MARNSSTSDGSGLSMLFPSHCFEKCVSGAYIQTRVVELACLLGAELKHQRRQRAERVLVQEPERRDIGRHVRLGLRPACISLVRRSGFCALVCSVRIKGVSAKEPKGRHGNRYMHLGLRPADRIGSLCYIMSKELSRHGMQHAT